MSNMFKTGRSRRDAAPLQEVPDYGYSPWDRPSEENYVDPSAVSDAMPLLLTRDPEPEPEASPEEPATAREDVTPAPAVREAFDFGVRPWEVPSAENTTITTDSTVEPMPTVPDETPVPEPMTSAATVTPPAPVSPRLEPIVQPWDLPSLDTPAVLDEAPLPAPVSFEIAMPESLVAATVTPSTPVVEVAEPVVQPWDLPFVETPVVPPVITQEPPAAELPAPVLVVAMPAPTIETAPEPSPASYVAPVAPATPAPPYQPPAPVTPHPAPTQQPPVHHAPAPQPPLPQAVQYAPVQDAPVQQPPVQQPPVQQPRLQQPPLEYAPVPQPPVQQTPVQAAPRQGFRLAAPGEAFHRAAGLAEDPTALTVDWNAPSWGQGALPSTLATWQPPQYNPSAQLEKYQSSPYLGSYYQPKKSHAGRWISAVLALLLAAGGTGYFVLKQHSTPKTTLPAGSGVAATDPTVPAAGPGDVYTSRSGHFAVRFPSGDKIDISSRSGSTGLVTYSMTGAGDDAGELAVLGEDLSINVPADRARDFLNGGADALGASSHLKYTAWHGRPAMVGTMQTDGQTVQVLYVLYGGQRIYLFLAGTTSKLNDLEKSFVALP